MNAVLLAQLLNGAFSAIAALRRQGMTNEQINARFDRVDAGGEAITADEVSVSLSSWQEQLDAGRKIQ